MADGIFARHIFAFGYTAFGKLFKIGINNYINNALAGIQEFLCKCFVYKFWRFCHPEFNGSGKFAVQIL